MDRLVDKKYWDDGWQNRLKQMPKYLPFFAHEILLQHLTHNSEHSVIEVGCVPGTSMIYFSKEFGYSVAGLDYSDTIQYMEPYLRSHGLTEFDLYHDDLFSFEPNEKYDVVFSAGFVEHFAQVEEVFERHYQLLKPNGTLIITLPHFRNFQKFIRIITGAKASLELHNLDVMFPEIWRSLAQGHNMNVMYCDYYKTFQFWLPGTHPRIFDLAATGSSYLLNRLLRLIKMDNIPNKYFSPNIVLIAKKTDQSL